MEYSTLADGYKVSELVDETGVGIFRLSSIPTDKAEPSEALRATAIWSEGLEAGKRLLSSSQLDPLRQRHSLPKQTQIPARRRPYFLKAQLTVPANSPLQTILHKEMLALAEGRQALDLERLTHEYLPLTFSRRHGDPSRPWNIFAIEVKDEQGQKMFNYQGNWRDLFQNWEALALSFPGYLESMIFKFLDSSTADGYNPYRVTRDRFEWEVINPHDAWSYFGYWGDHQVIYLLKLLDKSAAYHPQALSNLLTRRVFTYANVPYRIKPYDRLFQNPRHTIEFDTALD